MRRSPLLALASVAAVTGTLAVAPPSTAVTAPAPTPHTVVRHLVGPLSLAVQGRNVYVTQNFAGILTQKSQGKPATPLYTSKNGDEVGGVSARGRRVVFTETAGNEQGNTDSWLKTVTRSGGVRTIADIRDYENAKNPDSVVTYGVRGISDECAAQWPVDQAGPATYTGALDSHPYATTQTKRLTYVADAGMNAVLAVTRDGHIRTVAVTPAVAVPITSDLASQFGVPDCTVGLTYYGESVPTDVERAPGGDLIVTTEGGFLGESMPLGSVYRIDPRTGSTRQLATGLATPTGVAIAPNGDLLVAQLFAGEITRIDRRTHATSTFASVGLPAAVETSGRNVYATIDSLPPESGAPDGKVVRFGR